MIALLIPLLSPVRRVIKGLLSGFFIVMLFAVAVLIDGDDVMLLLLLRHFSCLLYTSPSPRDRQKSRMPSSA